MNQTISQLPIDYRHFDLGTLPCSLSDRILSPAIYIELVENSYSASLGAFILKSGESNFIPCLSNNHNWIFDGSRIKPLPYDTPAIITEAFHSGNLLELSYPEVIHLVRHGISGIEIVVAPEVTEKANSRSESMRLPGNIAGLNASLYPYQEHGVAWLNERINTVGGAILADEMGLGKTLQIIALFLLSRPSPIKPALIVCPTTLITNWCREIHKFAPELSLQIHRGYDRTGYYKDLMLADIVVTTYDTLANDLTMFCGVSWSYVICDEAQAVKNPDSKRRNAVASLTRDYTIPVTGTPIENSLMDFWSLADLAIPGVLENKDSFAECYPDTEDGAHELSTFSDSIILKRQVKDVADDLPPRTDIDLPIELDAEASKEYEKIRKETIDEYGKAGQLVAVGQLAIYCAHPWLRLRRGDFPDSEDCVELIPREGYSLMTPKMELCIQLLREAVYNQNKVLIFAAYNCCGDLIKKAADHNNIKVSYWNSINGGTPQQDRQSIVDQFSSTDGPSVLVLNPKAAGAGLNITAATVVIHYTQNWNPALEMQASARAHRRGQDKPVTVYRIFYTGTVEETMTERSLWKRELGGVAIPINTRDNQDLEKALMESPVSKKVI